MLKLHASGAKDVAAWRALLDDNFVCTMPITPFRSFKQVRATFCLTPSVILFNFLVVVFLLL
jgi:hypothetical protein